MNWARLAARWHHVRISTSLSSSTSPWNVLGISIFLETRYRISYRIVPRVLDVDFRYPARCAEGKIGNWKLGDIKKSQLHYLCWKLLHSSGHFDS